MLKSSFESISKYILWFAEHYHQAKVKLDQDVKNSSVEVKYKISSSYEEYCRKGKLLIQTRQGGAYSYMSPKEICSDEYILGHLHPIDVNIVTKLNYEEKQRIIYPSKQFRIIKETVSTCGILYSVYDPIRDLSFELSEDEILASPLFLENLKGQDGVSIGFNLGIKHNKQISSKIKQLYG